MEKNTVYLGDSMEIIKSFPSESIDCVVTSPPYYGLRDYGVKGQIGLEDTPEQYIERLVVLFREIRRCLKKEGTIWVNLGDSYLGGGWRNADFNEHSGTIQKGSKGTHCGATMPACKGYVNGYKPKDLIGIPWMFAFALRADGWYLRQDIIWSKPNPMPESVTDRCTKSHEYIFLLSKSEKYWYDYESIQEEAVTQIDSRIGSRVEYDGKRKGEDGTGNRSFVSLKVKGKKFGGVKYGENEDPHFRTKSGEEWNPQTDEEGMVIRNKRDVWSVNVKPVKEAHFATYPPMLIRPCILAGCPENGIVLDPFMGSGTTGIVARQLNRNFVGCELNPDYQKMAVRRIFNEGENLFNTQIEFSKR